MRFLSWLVLLATVSFLGGCFDPPRPKCAFLCSVDNPVCPEGYTCGGDGRCHLIENGVPAQCEDSLPADAGAADAPLDAPMAPDAEAVDAAPMTDAPPDAEPPPSTTHSGTISILDLSIAGHPELGSGLSISIDFPPVAGAKPPVYEETPGSPTGCKAWLYDTTAGDSFPPVGGDEGTVHIGGTNAPVPDCVFVGGAYRCIASAGADTATTILAAADSGGMLPPGTAMVTLGTATPFSAADVGRYVSLTGAINPANNGNFPVVNVVGPSAAVIVNPAAVTEPMPYASTYTVVAGAGPVPTSPIDAIDEDDMISVSITPGGGGHIMFPPQSFPAGDSFTLNTASQGVITNVPTNGTGFTLSCTGAGGACNSALGTIVLVTTTDAPVAGAPDYYFPAPQNKLAVVRCALIGASTVNVPDAAMAVVPMANPTRIRVTYTRVGFALTGNPDGTNPTNIVGGHTVMGFTTP